MSNLSEELASRGSKLCMQICVNNIEDDVYKGTISRKSRKHLLDDLISLGEIKWISPLTKEQYKEYQLNQLSKENSELIGLSDMDWSFWPSRQPQWDAIGIAPDSTLILVEAKAHTDEMESKGTEAKGESLVQIQKEIESVMGNDPVWMKDYYQTANRILFLSKLKKHYGEKRKVCLVFLNFIDDVTLTPESIEVWKDYINKMKSEHKFPKELESLIKYIYMDIWKEKGI